jgi:hypothetical protein
MGPKVGRYLTDQQLAGLVAQVTASPPLASSGGKFPNIYFPNQSANRILAGPSSGEAATPTFRSLSTADLPVVDLIHGGTGSILAGIPGGIAYGTSNALALSQAGNPGQVLTSNGVGAPIWADQASSSLTFRYGNKRYHGPTIPAGSLFLGEGFFQFLALPQEEPLIFFDPADSSKQNAFISLNGRTLAHGDLQEPNDVKLGPDPSVGDLIFSFPIHDGDFIEARTYLKRIP